MKDILEIRQGSLHRSYPTFGDLPMEIDDLPVFPFGVEMLTFAGNNARYNDGCFGNESIPDLKGMTVNDYVRVNQQ